MGMLSKLLLAAAGLAPTISALATYSPTTSGPSFKVGIPSGSSISASSAGDIYFQLSAPSTYQWVGLGIGEAMAGSHIFVMYADGTGNVTISARDGGAGHVEPQLDSTLMSGITLLAGSGIVGDTMIANVKCSTCTLLSSATSTSSPWICAWMTGSAIDSTSETYTLAQHGSNSMRQFTFDLTAASISSDANPFVSSTSPTATGTSPASPSSSSDSDSNSDSDSDSGSSSTVGYSATTISNCQKAHGIIMGVTVLLLFPLGASFMRIFGGPQIHALLQIFALIALICGFGVGIRLAHVTDQLYKSDATTHTVFGTVIIALFILQPFIGYFHHWQFKTTGGRTAASHVHIWYGRIIMILAAINGGLGLKLAANTKGGEIAYGVVAGVVALLYAAAVVAKRKSGGASFGGGKSGKKDITETEMGERIVTPPSR